MPSTLRLAALMAGCALATVACSPGEQKAKAPSAATAPAAAPKAAPVQADRSPLAQAVETAGPQTAPPADPTAISPALARVQVLLDRARFSPGSIDGVTGTNLKLAIEAFQQARGLTVDGEVTPDLWKALIEADGGPVLSDYVITEADAAGPYSKLIPKDDYEAMAKLPALSYTTPLEALAERFHMDEALLSALNPGADFGKAGTRIAVAALGPRELPAKVTRIDIDKGIGQVRAFDAQDNLLAVYPATVGSTERPAPSGELAVNTVAPRPTYTYDPSRLTFGKPKGKLTIKAGPNNPVGSTWIDLTKDTYGIHGTPDPKLVNKRASHGCVRLTNWDAEQLGAAVEKGAKVRFLGAEARAG
ncbi:L,D-transpeptidase family protein [Caulobacter hibisci]|uniref:Murein L,D-transpeptidase n=1 Tax=Caulobacter hibisci TaxID=2035993 RepID=A0ABS0T3Z1_9CAUL|nr:L,D-transpeptidase [Caulobacter hibisci]MBI1686584.1 murein L,D-transpeptidase [Caulobacter hibisci]